MRLSVIAIDVNDAQLESARSLGADLVINSRTESDYIDKIKAVTEGGAHAAVIFSAAKVAYDRAPATLR